MAQPGGVGGIESGGENGGSNGLCGYGETFLSTSGSGTWTLTQPGSNDPVAFFDASDQETLATNMAIGIGERDGTVDWTITTGLYVPLDNPSETVGLIIADVTLEDVGNGATTFRAVSIVDEATAAATIEAIREDGVTMLPPGEGSEMSLGSSCSCPACPLGGRFWVPFVVIGVGNVPGGQTCCGTACTAACDALHQGKSEAEAWLIGQGTWVTCMLCQ